MAPRPFDRYMVSIGAATHPKFAELTDGEWRAHFGGILAVAAMSPVRGTLLLGAAAATASHVGATAGVSTRTARSAMKKLQALGVLEHDDEFDCLRVHDWDDVNPSPSSAHRMRKMRAREQAAGDEKPVSEPVPRDTAITFLTRFFSSVRRVSSREVKSAAAQEGISSATLQRAREQLGVIVETQGRSTVWSLDDPNHDPDQTSHQRPESSVTSASHQRHISVTSASPEVEVEVLPTSPNGSVGRPRKRATRRVDQSVPPDDFPDALRPALDAVLPVLRGVWEERGGVEPAPRGVGLALMRNARADHLAVARKLEHWLLAGRGTRARCADVTARFGDWAEQEPAALRVVAGGSSRAEALVRADGWKAGYGDGAA